MQDARSEAQACCVCCSYPQLRRQDVIVGQIFASMRSSNLQPAKQRKEGPQLPQGWLAKRQAAEGCNKSPLTKLSIFLFQFVSEISFVFWNNVFCRLFAHPAEGSGVKMRRSLRCILGRATRLRDLLAGDAARFVRHLVLIII